MIHISGLGVAGSYLFRRLNDDGFDVSAYDPKREGYYLPCGYATNEFLLDTYLNNIGMGIGEYVLSRAQNVIFSGHNFDEISFNARGMCTIEKKRLEEDMVRGLHRGASAKMENADVMVDATGISRALLGPHPEDYRMYAREYLSPGSAHDDFYFYFFEGGHGYFWEFPLGGKYHVGAGSDSLEIINEKLSGYAREVVTGRMIRLAPLFDNVSRGNIIGVGEAVGTVSPIRGEGIVPSIKSAEFLFQALKKHSEPERIAEDYKAKLFREFGYYEKLRALVYKIQSGTKLGLSDLSSARLAKKDLEMFGIDFKMSKVSRHFL